MVSRIRSKVKQEILPLAAHTWYWQRAMRWIKQYGAFAVQVLDDEIESGSSVSSKERGIQQLLGDDELLEVFVASLTLSKVGFSVPRAARRFLSAARMRLGHLSLNDNKALTEIIRGHERKTPRTVIQAESLESDDVERIADAYGCSKNWWEVQVAAMITLCFIAILRLGELVVLRLDDVMLVLKNGKEVKVTDLNTIPRTSMVKGMFLHLRWRKAQQSHSVWVPVSCPTAISLLLRHLSLLTKAWRTSGYLFPSRVGRTRPTRNPTNHVSTSSMRRALKKALGDVCGLSKDQAKLFSGHSMRVGGSNFIRRLGIGDEVHRLLGGWASLTSSRKYFQLTSAEQFELTHKFALQGRVPPEVEGARMATLLSTRLMAVSGG